MTSPFRVLIADSMSTRAEEILRASPAVECDVRAGISAEELADCIGEYQGLLVRSRTKVRAEILKQAVNLKVIGRAGIGVDNIDVGVASERGILVENAPNGNAITTAEHAICLLLSLVRNIPTGTSSMKQNKWEKKKLEGTEIYGKTFGVVGLGNIGRIVADLGSGLRMKVIACDPAMDKAGAEKLGVELVSFADLLERSDFISIHTPLVESTRGLFGDTEFLAMREGAFLVNAARGGIVDEAACLTALESGRLAGAAFDVFVKEPAVENHPLVQHPKFICTPHLGASTAEAQIKVAEEVANQMVAYAESGAIINALNESSVAKR